MDILAYVTRAETSNKSAKVAVAICALNAYHGHPEQYLVPGRQQDRNQRFATSVTLAQITQADVDAASRARQLWTSGSRLEGAVSCYEPAVQDSLHAKKVTRYRYSSADLHRKWTLDDGMVLVLERWGWRFYAPSKQKGRDVQWQSKGPSKQHQVWWLSGIA